MVAGAATVLQGGLNRRIAEVWGTTPTILLNGLTLCVAATLTVWLASRSDSPFATLIGAKPAVLTRTQWWYFLPGCLGFFMLMVMPDGIARLGATQVFLLLVAGQLLAGLAWDHWVEGLRVSLTRIAGVALVFVGSWLSSRG